MTIDSNPKTAVTPKAEAALSGFINKHLKLGTGHPEGHPWKAGEFGKASLLGNTFSSIKSGSRQPTANHWEKMEKAFFPGPGSRTSANEHYRNWVRIKEAYLGVRSGDVETIDAPFYSKRDLWNIHLKPIRSNSTSLIHEGGGPGVVPWFSAEDITFSVKPDRFILPVPAWFADWASGRGKGEYETRPAVDFSGSSELTDFYGAVGMANLPALVAKHAEAYAQYVHAQYGAAGAFPTYNKEKLGLYGYRQPLPANRPERAYMDFRLYTTDYFTHRVMRGVLHEIRLAHPEWFNAADDFYSQHPFLRYFTTSFGLNLVVTTVSDTARNYHLVRVSPRLGNENQRSSLHITANEGLNTEDVKGAKVDLKSYTERALREELGVIDPADIESTVYIEFAMEMRNFEPYLSGLSHLRMTEAQLNLARSDHARDGRRETTNRTLLTYPFTAAGLIQPVLENERGVGDFTSYAPLILDSIVSRKELL